MRLTADLIANFCPNWSIAKKALTGWWVKKLRAHYITEADVIKGENNPKEKAAIVQKYRKKEHENLKDLLLTVDMVFDNTSVYEDRPDKEDIINDMLFCRLAYGFEADEYLFFGLENQSKEQREAWISDLDRFIYIHLMNDIKDIEIFNNKAKTYAMFHDYYGRDAISIKTGKDYQKFSRFIQTHKEFVKKKVTGSLGRSVELVSTKDIDSKAFFDSLIRTGEHIIEERIHQSNVMSALNESSVNTIRCITINTRDGIIIPYTFLKVGQKGSFVDNGNAGGILVGVDADTGVIVTHGHDESATIYQKHPETGVEFMGYELPRWNEMKAMCCEMAKMVPSIKCIGWDVALTDNGWIVVEGNWATQLVGPQIVLGRGLKKEFQEILKQVDLIIPSTSF